MTYRARFFPSLVRPSFVRSSLARPLTAGLIAGFVGLVGLVGCDAPERTDDGTPEPEAAEPDAIAPEPDTVVEALDVRFTQAVGGAMQVNPDVFPSITLALATTGAPDAVQLRVGAETFDAAAGDEGEWSVVLDVGALGDGVYALEATASAAGSDDALAAAELVVSDTGSQLTDFDEVGAAATPRLHRLEGPRGTQLFMTWADRSDPDGVRRAWLSEVDGAGRFVGPKTALTPKDAEALYARAAIAGDRVAVLAQEPGGPYKTRLWITTHDGVVVLGPIDLDPEGWYGSFGGDITTDDNHGFVLTWRAYTQDAATGESTSEVRWLRVTDDLEITGPIVLASSADAAWSGFTPHTFLTIAANDERSVVGFVQNQYSTVLEQDVPRARYFSVAPSGDVIETSVVHAAWTDWHHHARVSDAGDELVAYWATADLLEEALPNTINFFGGDAAFALLLPQSTPWVTGPGERWEPWLIAHGEGRAMTWLDLRSNIEQPQAGKIELMASTFSEGMSMGSPTTFRHAVFILGTSQLRATSLGPNVALTWLDERHGGSILNSRPELWFDTLWVQ